METSLSGWMVVFGCRLTRAALARCALSSALARGELWNTRLDWHNCSLSVSGTSMSQQSPLLPFSWCKILGSDVHRASSPFVRPVNRATLIREVGGPLIKHPLQVAACPHVVTFAVSYGSDSVETSWKNGCGYGCGTGLSSAVPQESMTNTNIQQQLNTARKAQQYPQTQLLNTHGHMCTHSNSSKIWQ